MSEGASSCQGGVTLGKIMNYHTIMDYLRSKDQYRDIVEILDKEYQRNLQDAQPGM